MIRFMKIKKNQAFSLMFLMVLFFSSILLGAEKEKKQQKENQDIKKEKTQLPKEEKEDETQDLQGMPINFPKPFPVSVSIIIDQLNSINETSGTFSCTFDLKLTWTNPSEAFDPIVNGSFRKEICHEKADEALKTMWNPEIIVTNIKDKPSNVSKCILISADGTVQYIQRIQATMTSDFSLIDFPFDSQYLTINLESIQYDATELQFTQSQNDIYNSGISKDVELENWHIDGLSYSKSENRGLDGKFYPDFEVIITLKRYPGSDLLSFMPLILIVFMPTLATLFFKAELQSNISSWSAALLALIAMSFALNLKYPSLESNSIINQIINIFFGYIFVMIILSLTVFNSKIAEKVKNPYIVPELKRFLSWSIPIGLIILVVVVTILTALNY